MQDSLTKPFGADSLLCLDQTTSTMDEARSLSAMRPFGAVMAESQTAGRGRIPGRTWETRPGQALLATLWFPRTGLEPPVSLLAGLAVVKACQFWAKSANSSFSNGLTIKWPNDLLCGNRKLAGILGEASSSTMYVGIGINCSQDSFTSAYKTEPTSILLETGLIPDRHQLLAMILEELHALLTKPAGWLEELGQLLAWKGKTVEFRQGITDGEPLRGVLAGISEDGGLILETGASSVCFHSGELSLVIDECS